MTYAEQETYESGFIFAVTEWAGTANYVARTITSKLRTLLKLGRHFTLPQNYLAEMRLSPTQSRQMFGPSVSSSTSYAHSKSHS